MTGTLRRMRHKLNNSVWLRVRERFEQNSVNNGKDRRIGTDAQAQNAQGSKRKYWPLSKDSGEVSNVSKKTIHSHPQSP